MAGCLGDGMVAAQQVRGVSIQKRPVLIRLIKIAEVYSILSNLSSQPNSQTPSQDANNPIRVHSMPSAPLLTDELPLLHFRLLITFRPAFRTLCLVICPGTRDLFILGEVDEVR